MMELGDEINSLDAINKAIALNEHDHVLYHIKGMIIGKLAINKMDNYKRSQERPIEWLKDIQKNVDDAGEQFTKSRLFSPPELEHGYVSHITLLLRTVDFGYAILGYASREDYIVSTEATWFRNLLDISEDLIYSLEKIHEGEKASIYQTKCISKLREQYGDFTSALKNWTKLLARNDVYRPIVRRHIADTYLTRVERIWDKLSHSEIDHILDLMEKNLQEEPGTERNIKLWFEAARRSDRYNIDTAIERLTYWKLNTNSIIATFYLYVLYAIQVIEGSGMALSKCKDILNECSREARNKGLRIRTNSIEWLGKQQGLKRLIKHDQLGEWEDEFETGNSLALIKGRIASIDSPAGGIIELSCGLTAFFVPSRGFNGKVYYKGKDENKNVNMYLAFSYDGLRAWAVRDV